MLDVDTLTGEGLACGTTVLALGINMGASSCPTRSTSQPVPCLLPGKVADDGPSPQVPAPTWETLKKLLAHSFRTAKHLLMQPFGE